MKNLLTLVAVGVLAFCAYKYYTDHAQKPAPELTAADRSAKPAPGQAVAISTMIDPWHRALFADINHKRPDDLVPPLTIAKERIVEGRALVEPQKHRVYDTAATLITTMINVAEERTKALEATLQAEANDKSSLDSKNTISASRTFFAQATVRRWEQEKLRSKGQIDQLMKLLVEAEQQWNSQVDPNSPTDSYDLAALKPVRVTVDQAVIGANQLEKGKYDKSRTNYPWRRVYYESYGSRQ